MGLMLDGLDLLGTRPAPQDGVPMRLPVDLIDEDPGQPRQEFDEASLHELAETIRERGVRQPISVRPNPAIEGRWLLNFGARRLRASKLAGKADIPAFVDLSAESYDQVIENEQREGLKPLELALFVQRRLVAGESQAEIARRMGKSKAYVTYAIALIDAPDWLLAAYREGRCRGLRELYELRRAADESEADVEAWVRSKSTITRKEVKALAAPAPTEGDVVRKPAQAALPGPRPDKDHDAETGRPRSLRLEAQMAGVWVEVRLDRLPDEPHCAFVKRPAAREWASVPVAELIVLRLLAD